MLEATAVAPRTVVEACFDPTGSASLDLVYAVASEVALTDQSVRLAIRRMETSGELVQSGRGRKGRLTLSATARARSAREHDYITFAQAQDEGRIGWDGLWRLVLFSMAEKRRAERDALRQTLTALGAVALIPGAYLSPHDLHEDLESMLGTIPDHTLVETEALHVPGADSAAAVAATQWPLAEIRAGYEPLATALDELDAREPEEGGSTVAEVATALRLAELFIRGIQDDPLLPPELLDHDWPPARTRRRFHRRWADLSKTDQGLQLFRLLAT